MTTYFELDCNGLAFGLAGVEVMSLNAGCLDLDETSNNPYGGALMVRFDFGWLAGMLWLGPLGPEPNVYRRGAHASVIDLSRLETSQRDWRDFDPTDADLAEIEAELAIEALFDFGEK